VGFKEQKKTFCFLKPAYLAWCKQSFKAHLHYSKNPAMLAGFKNASYFFFFSLKRDFCYHINDP
jgi:hypothetical protein